MQTETGTAAETDKTAYIPTEKERHLYHVQLEKPLYDKRTGKRLSVPKVQKMTKAGYRALVNKRNEKDKSNAEMLGYTVKVLWDPETSDKLQAK